MADTLRGQGCVWVFDAGALRIEPDAKAPKLMRALGNRHVPYEALADVALTPGKRGTVVLRLVPRRGADPVMTVAAGQLDDALDPYRLVLPAKMETLAEYYADEMRAAVTAQGPIERFLVTAPPVPRTFKAWDAAASFDGYAVSFKWFWSGASSAKYSLGDQSFPVADIEGVEWHAPSAASGSLRLRIRGHDAPADADKDPASVVFGLGYGATHESLPFAAAVLAAIRPPAASGAVSGAALDAALDAATKPVAHDGTASAAGTGAGSAAELTDLIRKLGELRDAGLLTEEEFQAKKAELLDRL